MCGSESERGAGGRIDFKTTASSQSLTNISVDSGLASDKSRPPSSNAGSLSNLEEIGEEGRPASVSGCSADVMRFERRPSIRVGKTTEQVLLRSARQTVMAVGSDDNVAVVQETNLDDVELNELSRPFEDILASKDISTGNDDASSVSASLREDVKEIQERRASPLRFSSSHSRRRASPVRIPTVFARADKEANKYRELAQAALRASPKPNIKRPALPITSDNVALMTSRARLELRTPSHEVSSKESPEFNDPSAGSTPSRLLHKLKYSSVEISCTDDVTTAAASDHNCSENIENLLATPKIKQGLLLPPTGRAGKIGKLQTMASSNGDVMHRVSSSCKTPIKPLKRLQGFSPSAKACRSPLTPGRKNTNKTS